MTGGTEAVVGQPRPAAAQHRHPVEGERRAAGVDVDPGVPAGASGKNGIV